MKQDLGHRALPNLRQNVKTIHYEVYIIAMKFVAFIGVHNFIILVKIFIPKYLYNDNIINKRC